MLQTACYFGVFISSISHEQYAEIWDLDEKDPFSKTEGGESVADVVSRLTNVLVQIERDFQG